MEPPKTISNEQYTTDKNIKQIEKQIPKSLSSKLKFFEN